jgi:hypothetical protein
VRQISQRQRRVLCSRDIVAQVQELLEGLQALADSKGQSQGCFRKRPNPSRRLPLVMRRMTVAANPERALLNLKTRGSFISSPAAVCLMVNATKTVAVVVLTFKSYTNMFEGPPSTLTGAR